MDNGRFQIAVKTLHGLEGVLEQELKKLNIKGVKRVKRAVLADADLKDVYRINMFARTALRVLVEIEQFDARDEEQLYRAVNRIDWTQWLTPAMTFAIDPVVKSTYFPHSHYAALKVKDAIVDHVRKKTGARPSIDKKDPHIRVNLLIAKDRVTLSLDSSGKPLNQRGYRRRSSHQAPINEVLASGLLLLAGYDGSQALYDPFCGSGTLLAEAVQIATNQAPGLMRRNFGFMHWGSYDEDLYDEVRSEATRAMNKNAAFRIEGGDIDRLSVAEADQIVNKAGMTRREITIRQADFFADDPPFESGMIVTNPPYGERLLIDEEAFFPMIGDRLKQAYSGWDAWLILPFNEHSKKLGLRAEKNIELYNGSLDCRLRHFELYEGSKEEA